MISKKQQQIILEGIIEKLELPDSAYENAKNRYEDIGKWLERKGSEVVGYSPHIFPQGSFRLGTAIRPLADDEEYDLDLSCKLQSGISKYTHTQEFLKEIVGVELKKYRQYRNISKPLESKHRCWRLEYQDDLSFHIDIVPSIPQDADTKKVIYDQMRNSEYGLNVASFISDQVLAITDDRDNHYRTISPIWKVSNPEGYARWFEVRMSPKYDSFNLRQSQVDKLPVYKRKNPLQRVIQILKRHRDIKYNNDEIRDSKPISIIITTLAAKAYNGETDIISALNAVLAGMGNYVNEARPKVPNPVNEAEDFADRWYDPKYSYLNLEDHFWSWLSNAIEDFNLLYNLDTEAKISKFASDKFSVRTDSSQIISKISKYSGVGVAGSLLSSAAKNDELSFPDKPVVPNKTGGFA